jgi:hypothetical protein
MFACYEKINSDKKELNDETGIVESYDPITKQITVRLDYPYLNMEGTRIESIITDISNIVDIESPLQALDKLTLHPSTKLGIKSKMEEIYEEIIKRNPKDNKIQYTDLIKLLLSTQRELYLMLKKNV